MNIALLLKFQSDHSFHSPDFSEGRTTDKVVWECVSVASIFFPKYFPRPPSTTKFLLSLRQSWQTVLSLNGEKLTKKEKIAKRPKLFKELTEKAASEKQWRNISS